MPPTHWDRPEPRITVLLPDRATTASVTLSVNDWISIYLDLQSDAVFMAEVERRSEG
jgi:hypothetical protein